MRPRILATKLHIPSWSDNAVSRPRLLALLNTGVRDQRKLTLVSAPAGYGKTTLIAEWYHLLPEGVHGAWLSLDEADNDLLRFLGHWLAAFQNVAPAVGDKVRSLLEIPQLPPVDHLMDELINDLSSLERPTLLTLDDYHVITNATIHQAVAYFLDHLPAQVHLVMTTRADPSLPLARMRARGQMTEIRAQDLRFTWEEGRQFFGRISALDLTDETLIALDERNEGWAAGLQLAALALQHQSNPAAFVETFRGSHRYVLDYLAEEVIRQLGEPTRAFLMQTSILERFNAEVCAALTGREDSLAVIAQLEQANLFVIPLDDERRWYRYHRLFVDYLRSLLSKVERQALCRQASIWHEENDFTAEAVRYALESGDPEFTANVIGRALAKETTWSQGDLAQWLTWLDGLPAQVYPSRPQLSLNVSRVLYLSGRFDQAEALLIQTEEMLQSGELKQETEQMIALAELYRGSIASVRGDFEQTVQRTEYALARIPRENHLAYARGYFSLGMAYEIADQTGQAAQNYLKSSAEAREAGVLFLAMHALCAAAQVQIKQGRLHQAEQSCQIAIQYAQGARLYPLGLAWSILGGIAIERNDLSTAERYLSEGIALSRQGGLMDDVVLGEAYLARLRVYQGELPVALKALENIKVLMTSFGVQRMEILAGAVLARLNLILGQVDVAVKWVEGYRLHREQFSREFEELTFARTLLATGALDELPSIVHPILNKAVAAERTQTVIEAMILLSQYHLARREVEPALEWLEKSLRLANPEGYLRIYLDEGKALMGLFPRVRHAAPELVNLILGQQQVELAPQPSLGETLLDPLSQQEIRVLKLIVEGKSNQEIAEELVISVGTAKWHVHNVLQKLGASNRPQAIARARELGF